MNFFYIFSSKNEVYGSYGIKIKNLISLLILHFVSNGSELQKGVRNNIQLVYNTYLNDIFDVPKYAKALNEVAKEKSIIVHLRRNLKIVDLIKKEAVFEILDTDAKATGETDTQNVSVFC